MVTTSTAGPPPPAYYQHQPQRQSQIQLQPPQPQLQPKPAAKPKQNETKEVSSPVATAPRRFPCKARRLRAKNHTIETAYLEVPPNTKHGAMIRCSHPDCSKNGRAFRWCAVCDLPVAKRNFMKRHSHGLVSSVRYTLRHYVRDQIRQTEEQSEGTSKTSASSTTSSSTTDNKTSGTVGSNQQAQSKIPTGAFLNTDSVYCRPVGTSNNDNDPSVATSSGDTGFPTGSSGSISPATDWKNTNSDGSYSPSLHPGSQSPRFMMSSDVAKTRAMLTGSETSAPAASSSSSSSSRPPSPQQRPSSDDGYKVDWSAMPMEQGSGGRRNRSRRSSTTLRSTSPLSEQALSGQQFQQDMFDEVDLEDILGPGSKQGQRLSTSYGRLAGSDSDSDKIGAARESTIYGRLTGSDSDSDRIDTGRKRTT